MLLSTKDGIIIGKETTEVTNDVVNSADFKSYVHQFECSSNPSGIRYSKWVFLQLDAGPDLRHLHDELLRNHCDVVGACLLPGEKLSAVCRRTQVKKSLVIQGVDGIIKYYTINAKTCNPKNVNLVIVAIIKAWEKVGTNYIKNYDVISPTNVNSFQLYREWENLTIDQVQWEILEATEKVRLKRPHSDRDELVAKMGRDLLRRKREAMTANSAFKRFADDSTIIPLTGFINLDKIVCRTEAC